MAVHGDNPGSRKDLCCWILGGGVYEKAQKTTDELYYVAHYLLVGYPLQRG